ncbi:MAG: formimidoylglutamate deiminase [Caulobacteraceae bacterium]
MQVLWFDAALLPGGWARDVRIAVDEGRIAAIDAGEPPRAGDERGGAAVAGLCNVHSHAFQRGMAGLAETRGPAHDDFWTWREVMYRFLGRLEPQDVRTIASLAYIEMLESGFTRVGEFHYLHNDPTGAPYADPAEMAESIAAAAGETRIGLTLLPVFYAHGGFGGAAPTAGQRRFISDLDGFAELFAGARRAVAGLPDAVLGVAPHSLRAVTAAELTAVTTLCAGGPVHIHAAEQVLEVEDCVAWSGRRPVEWLLENAAIDDRWCLIHATHLTGAETGALAASGAVAGLCPITEANLGDGVFPARAYIDAGGRFGIGTDSNVLIDAAGELRAIEYVQRVTRRSRGVLATGEGASVGRTLFDGSSSGGARALGAGEAGFRPGAPADIVSLDLAHPSLAGRTGDALLDGWIFAAGGGAVEAVWRGGRKVVAAGRHVSRDAIAESYRRLMIDILGT